MTKTTNGTTTNAMDDSDHHKGILKTTKIAKPKRKILWDEVNLAENEVVQQSIIEHCNNTRRIDEPKTPYVNYVLSDDEDMADHQSSNSDGTSSVTTTPVKMMIDDDEYVVDGDEENDDQMLTTPPKIFNSSPQSSTDTNHLKMSPREAPSKVILPTDQMEHLQSAFSKVVADDEPHAKKHTYYDHPHDHEHESEEFAKKRKQHYNEYLVVKMMRERGALDEDDEE